MNRIIDEDSHDICELVQTTTLDKLLVSEQNISLIKIDVEGYEKKVLLGCEKTLQNPNLQVIIIELNNSSLNYNYDENETIAILNKYGFLPYRYIYPGNTLASLEKKNYKSHNTIFIRNINYVKKKIEQKLVTINKNTVKFTNSSII